MTTHLKAEISPMDRIGFKLMAVDKQHAHNCTMTMATHLKAKILNKQLGLEVNGVEMVDLAMPELDTNPAFLVMGKAGIF